MIEEVAWMILRIVFAGMFLFPLKDIVRDMDASMEVVRLIMPFQARFFTYVIIAVMFLGALSILLGAYAQIAGFFLLIYCLMGVALHYRLSNRIASIKLSASASEKDQHSLSEVAALGILGNQTSGQKNIVLSAVACFFMLLGSGPISLTTNLF